MKPFRPSTGVSTLHPVGSSLKPSLPEIALDRFDQLVFLAFSRQMFSAEQDAYSATSFASFARRSYSYLHSVRPPMVFYAFRDFRSRLCRMDAGSHEHGVESLKWVCNGLRSPE